MKSAFWGSLLFLAAGPVSELRSQERTASALSVAISPSPLRSDGGVVVLARTTRVPRVVVLVDTSVLTWSTYVAALAVGDRLERIHADTLTADLLLVPRGRRDSVETDAQRQVDRRKVAPVIDALRKSHPRVLDGVGSVRAISVTRSPSLRRKR